MPVHASVLDLIGNTPLVDVSQLSPTPGVRIVAKLEGQNPGGSIKDRIAKAMVEAAEADGTLKPGQTLLEPSSGNTGIGLAMVCLLKGYPLQDRPARERVARAPAAAGDLRGRRSSRRPGSEGSNGAVRMAQRLAAEDPSVAFLYQYGNPANPRAHYETTGPEILRDCPEVTHLVAGLGTAGTLMGTGRFFREHKPSVEMWAVEPPAGEMVEGLRNLDDGFVPPVYDPAFIDRRIIVRPKESIEWTRRLTAEAGIFGGISAGAAMAGAAKAAAQIDRGRDRGGPGRRRLEVPLDRRLDRPHRRGRGEGQEDHLLLKAGRTTSGCRFRLRGDVAGASAALAADAVGVGVEAVAIGAHHREAAVGDVAAVEVGRARGDAHAGIGRVAAGGGCLGDEWCDRRPSAARWGGRAEGLSSPGPGWPAGR